MYDFDIQLVSCSRCAESNCGDVFAGDHDCVDGPVAEASPGDLQTALPAECPDTGVGDLHREEIVVLASNGVLADVLVRIACHFLSTFPALGEGAVDIKGAGRSFDLTGSTYPEKGMTRKRWSSNHLNRTQCVLLAGFFMIHRSVNLENFAGRSLLFWVLSTQVTAQRLCRQLGVHHI